MVHHLMLLDSTRLDEVSLPEITAVTCKLTGSNKRAAALCWNVNSTT